VILEPDLPTALQEVQRRRLAGVVASRATKGLPDPGIRTRQFGDALDEIFVQFDTLLAHGLRLILLGNTIVSALRLVDPITTTQSTAE
jgi:hypothetical protein